MRVLVGQGSCGIAAGAGKIFAELQKAVNDNQIKADVLCTGCMGACYLEPIVEVFDDNNNRHTYVRVSLDDVPGLVEKHLIGKTPVSELLISEEDTGKQKRQKKVTLRNCGLINPEDIDEYIAVGGYEAAKKYVTELGADAVIANLKTSGLRGRGGGGFPTWFKWNAGKNSPSDKKYIICNADEGDPGAFMDRAIMEGDPHSMLEGMLIGGFAIGADEGIIYVRAEYPLAIKRLEIAMKQAREKGYLGKNLFGSDFNFDIRIKAGAGAFVCGEETALIASVEGKRGMPTLKPPFPTEKGLFGKPTVINNVETLANIPWIMEKGGEAFAAIGTESSSGTKTFALTGHVKKTGLIEIPFGITLREIVEELGGGVTDDNNVLTGGSYKAVQIGGPSGGCLTQEHIDMPLDYDSLKAVGAMVGSGGIVVMNEYTCMVKIARYFMQFTQNESCGKCVVCREGTRQMLALLDDIIDGTATEATITLLQELAETVQIGSLCALGKTAPNPVLSALRYFRDEVEAHVIDKRCPTGNCEALLSYTIIPELCKSCTLCAKKCPVDCISGSKGVPYVIDAEKCIKCGVCMDVCKFNAVVKGKGA